MKERFYIIRDRVVNNWPTYGPSVVGAVLVLLALFVGYRIWTGRSGVATMPPEPDNNISLTTEPTPTPVVPDTEPSSNLVVGSGGTPVTTITPVQASQGTDSATTAGVPGTLPETGFPLFAILPGFGLAAAGGFKLLKSKRV